jgi:hypothetical protein
MKTLVVSFNQSGEGRCLYTDALPFAEIGTATIARASEVEFNNSTGQWEVRLASDPGHVAFAHPSRERCIEWEVNTINERLLA